MRSQQHNSILRGKRFRFLTLAICLFVLSGFEDFVASARGTENLSVRIGRIALGRHGVIIHADRVRLPILLKKITAQSRIDFRINDSLWNELITADVVESNWPDAVFKVLAGFNRVDLWSDTRELDSVYVLGKLGDFDPSLVADRAAQERTKPGALPIGKLKKLTQVRLRGPFPVKLWVDEEIRAYLRRYGISAKSDLTSPKMVMQVRRTARKELRAILNKKTRAP